jgi:DNA modification methylase
MSDPLTIIHGDALSSLQTLESESVQTCVTSPPYWGLRDYGHDSQIGLEKTPDEYVARLVEIFREVKRALKKDGTLWLNLGDSYAGGGRGGNPDESPHRKQATNTGSVIGVTKNPWPVPTNCKPKDLVGIPWMVAFALRADGWYLRSDIIWSKPNPMPESVTDRPTKSHEYVFLLSKSQRYYFDQDTVREPAEWARWGNQTCKKDYRGIQPIDMDSLNDRREQGRNIRSVWTVATAPFSGAHFATFPPDLIKPCILAGAPVGGVVMDCFAGSGTTGKVAIELGRKAILIEPKAEYIEMIKRRCETTIGLPLVV